MSTKQEEKPESTDMFKTLRDEITVLQRQNKGLKGENAKLKRKEGVTNMKQVESSPNEPDSSQSKAAQAEPAEFLRPYEKYCADCGAVNPNYVKPNLMCKDCNVPLGRISKVEDGEKIKNCWNCGGTKSIWDEKA